MPTKSEGKKTTELKRFLLPGAERSLINDNQSSALHTARHSGLFQNSSDGLEMVDLECCCYEIPKN